MLVALYKPADFTNKEYKIVGGVRKFINTDPIFFKCVVPRLGRQYKRVVTGSGEGLKTEKVLFE